MDPPGTLMYRTGFMGSGKSAVGPGLARLIGFGHADLDAAIEQRTGLSVAEIFRSGGEGQFRKIEREALEELSGMQSTVIALGGGTLLDAQNLRLVKATGMLVYLEADTGILLPRLRRGPMRPLLSTHRGGPHGETEMGEIVRKLLEKRKPGYETADFTVSAANDDPSATAGAIAAFIRVGPEHQPPT
jgi:shikimate kinase